VQQIADAVGAHAVTCVAGGAVEALLIALELRPDAVVVGTAIRDPPSTLLRTLASEDRLSDVRRVALAREREEDPSEELHYAAGAELVLPEAGTLGERWYGVAIPG
jgi:hypothetical protein